MAKKEKIVFVCSECGETYPKWMGQCQSCRAWNSLEEKNLRPSASTSVSSTAVVSMTKQGAGEQQRLSTGLLEFDRMLGGGIVPGGVLLIGGEPGAGKSTLLLTIAKSMGKVLYVAGEESSGQVLDRAERIGAVSDGVIVFQETSLPDILEQAEKWKPDILMVDSIQTVYSGELRGFSGSPVQIREAAGSLIEFAKRTNTPVIMTGHITKDGQIAGPKLLEHAVDVVLYFETQTSDAYRIVRSVKNRFGATGEIAAFEMTAEGLHEIPASRGLLRIDETGGIGSVLFPQLAGSQIIPLEIQVLVTPAGFTNGRRIGENLDNSKIHLTAAILEKYLRLKMSQMDIFVRVQGGTPLDDSAGDLALLVAMLESYLERNLPFRGGIAGEVSLTGSVRLPSVAERRKKAFEALGVGGFLFGGKGEEKDVRYIQRVEDFREFLKEKN